MVTERVVKQFFGFSLVYFCVAMGMMVLFRDNPGMQVQDALLRTGRTVSALIGYLPYLLAAAAAIFLATRKFASRANALEAVWAFAACLIFAMSFAFMKTTLPFVVPFYADPFFAELDKALHFGVDPWVVTHRLAHGLSPDLISTLYFAVWGLPAVFFPLLLAVFDSDAQRKRTYLILYVFVWVGLGNLLAYLGSSVGPVYYDRLLGTDRFAELLASLQASGLPDSKLGLVQDSLWTLYSEHAQMIGTGISAFPSVHNGVAALVMFYLWDRSKWLAPVGMGFCAAILFASVYIGWHYALDGYVSILAVWAAWLGLRKWTAGRSADRRSPTPLDVPPVPAE